LTADLNFPGSVCQHKNILAYIFLAQPESSSL